MSRQDEIIEQLTSGMTREDKRKIVAFLKGKGSLSGEEYTKFSSIMAKYEKAIKKDNELDEFLKEYRTTNTRPWSGSSLEYRFKVLGT